MQTLHSDSISMGDWWARDRGPDTATWIARYQHSLDQRHRQVLTDVITALAPEDLLEVGCHCGPNLIRLARTLPTTRMHGIEISPDAVKAGQTWCAVEQVADRVQIFEGRIPARLDALPDSAYDVALSCYTLAYLGPEDVDVALYELGRLTTRALVLVEPSPTSPPRESAAGYREWRHDYRDRCRWIGSLMGRTLTPHPITPPVDTLTEVLVWEAQESPEAGT